MSRSKSEIAHIEFADFQVAEVNSIEVVVNLFKTNIFATKNLADEDATLMPTNVACM
jgi:hypothetical protein